MIKRPLSYSEIVNRYSEIKSIYDGGCREVTFQITDDCCCACTYCYQGHKGHNYMSKEIAKACVDLLFKMYDEDLPDAFINKKTCGLILDFIGGEPLMGIDIIDYICDYFMNKCIELHHPWLYNFRISFISNGALYFKPEVQAFIQKYKNFLSMDITLDGPKEIHDTCRIYHDGRGNFDDAYAAFQDLKKMGHMPGTKVTIARENLKNLMDIIKFYVNEGSDIINANCVYEVNWNYEDGKKLYKELKDAADYLLSLDHEVYFGFFDDFIGKPMPETELTCWCGGQGLMLSFGPDGTAYPCQRYAPISLGDSQPPLISGNCFDGIYNTPETKKLLEDMRAVDRRTKNTDECFYCPIAYGCADCAAWNYQQNGSLNKRSTNICNAHKARVLANVYYWNKVYLRDTPEKVFELNLPKEDCLNFIDEDEYNMLMELQKRDV